MEFQTEKLFLSSILVENRLIVKYITVKFKIEIKRSLSILYIFKTKERSYIKKKIRTKSDF